MKNKEVLKMFYRIIITIVLTLGLSMSFQSVLADWRQPTADPPEDNVDPPIVNVADPLDYNLNNYAIIGQEFVTISGNLGLNGNLTVGGLTNCNTIDTDASGNFVCGTDDSGMSSLAANSVGSSEVIDNSLTAADLATGSVGSAEVIDNSLTATDLAANSVGTSEIISSEVQNRVTGSCSYGINSINENGTITCSGGGWKLLAQSSSRDEETHITLYPGKTYSVNAVGTVRVEVVNSGWDPDLYIHDIAFIVSSPDDVFCTGGNGTADIRRGNDGTAPVCKECLQTGAQRSCNTNRQPQNWIALDINDVRKANCPPSTSSSYGLYGYYDVGTRCVYPVNGQVSKLEVWQVDWSEALGRWMWEIYYR